MHQKERRIMERFTFKLPVAVQCESNPGEYRTHELTTSNVCAGGAYIEASAPYPVGTRLNLIMHLSVSGADQAPQKKSQIELDGAVTRSDSNGMAVTFDSRYKILPATA
jgi:hypothetical protein